MENEEGTKPKKKDRFVVETVTTETQQVIMDREMEAQLNINEAIIKILNNQAKIMKLLN